ncbi:hypothetical protein BCV69DRAFT_288419 [Microstroma glucosiphilum]|uniref:CTLH domain-containing protein n=1 Tax=Pseudomicrostroma glucosiphilum TaxID=1684307 RepID=A0A316U1P5_9BASI|nr:hypothetical protein BCV69DRAFT_288419 [Pseudomicrostroma glucosiphilum]PWN18363.1 hypothetical protein BCV69DRAFT_288419 [Pseudomicrostroma glucosiphilum]
MDAIEKEVEKVITKLPVLYPVAPTSTRRTARPRVSSTSASSSTTTTVAEILDELLTSLETIQSALKSGSTTAPSAPVVLAETKSAIARSQKAFNDRTKEVYNALARSGKAYDKKFTTSVEGIANPKLSMGDEAQQALEAVVMDHLLRMGEWDAAQQLSQKSGLPLPPSEVYSQLESISQALTSGHLQPAIEWAQVNRPFLESRSSQLEFALQRSQFLRIAIGAPALSGASVTTSLMATDSDGENVTMTRPSSSASFYSPIEEAMHYGRKHFGHHRASQLSELQALYTFILFLPPTGLTDPDAGSSSHYLARLHQQVPLVYHRFLDANRMHSALLEPVFQAEFCARNQLARDPPLKIAVEVGTGGALQKIMKVRQVMKIRGNEWSQAEELPIDIPLPSHLRFHSTFTCPVSKEQATEDNHR